MSESNIPNAGGASPARGEPNHIRRVVILWIVFSVVGIVLWLLVYPYILPSSVITDVAVFGNITIVLFTVLAVPVAMFVWVFAGYSLFAFRVKEQTTEDGPPLHPTPAIQVGWLGITGVLCLFLIIWGLFGYYAQTTAATPSNTLVVQVTAQQWEWTFQYQDSTGAWIPSQGQVLELPVNRPVEFLVTSEDVLHGFEIQELGVRQDANPGQVVTVPPVTPTQTGVFSVRCVEMCGLYHSYMWSAVNVVDQQTFNAYLASLGGHP